MSKKKISDLKEIVKVFENSLPVSTTFDNLDIRSLQPYLNK